MIDTSALGAIIDLFRTGSLRKRCSFEHLRSYDLNRLCPAYVAGMRDGLRLLHADAARRLRTGDAVSAAERLAMCHRIVAHLSGDEPLMSALVAHDAFLGIQELVEEASSDAEARRMLLDAAETIGRKDPFGYIGSVSAERAYIIAWVNGRRWLESETHEHVDALIAQVQGWDGDQVFYYLAVQDTMLRAAERGAEDEAPARRDPLQHMDGVISLDQLADVRDQVPRIAPILAAGEMDIFTGREIPRFGHIVERMHAARGDLQRGLRMLRASPDEPEEEQEDDS